jgi:hypothetical protein
MLDWNPTLKIADTAPRGLQKSRKAKRRSEFPCSLHPWSWKILRSLAANPTPLASVESIGAARKIQDWLGLSCRWLLWNDKLNRSPSLGDHFTEAFFVCEIIGLVQMRDFTNKFVDLVRDAPVVRMEWSHCHQLATGFEEVKLRLEVSHLSSLRSKNREVLAQSGLLQVGKLQRLRAKLKT